MVFSDIYAHILNIYAYKYTRGEVSVNTQYFLEHLIFLRKSIQQLFEKYAKKGWFETKKAVFLCHAHYSGFFSSLLNRCQVVLGCAVASARAHLVYADRTSK